MTSNAPLQKPTTPKRKRVLACACASQPPLTLSIPHLNLNALNPRESESPRSRNVTDQLEHLELCAAPIEELPCLSGTPPQKKSRHMQSDEKPLPTDGTQYKFATTSNGFEEQIVDSSQRSDAIVVASSANTSNAGLPLPTPIDAQRPKPKRKRSLSPPLPSSSNSDGVESLTWQESEITGHDINGPDDDGTGINGIGFKPTSAQAYDRIQKRKQQVQEWKAREARDERQRRSERRRGVEPDLLTQSAAIEPGSPKRAVRFV